ncbi:Na+/H+ antiporter NhaC [Pseudoleptotrichia goodfellowii]|uniref:Na+/H+ antiporter NhaC n=2 Tax=Pseudoleptotrichia goodfellowii TaxID=157692 RepID=D0GP44_9FUSO|nr:Na+/H+ antiporter NhaC [Pseudoleptotrichia goodfellowii]EEY34143.1 Na+/H+ antiporter NhaC [Pseudoleptotrichia goodfellowii F0264]BBM37017.1 transporter, NhaC family [Pseudoleptotrichia goodfellowii]
MKRKVSFIEAVMPIIFMILLLGIGYGIYGLRAEILMLISASLASIIAVKNGYTWDDIMNSIVNKLSKTMPAILILIIVGLLIGSWMIGGTIPMMIYYGLKIISPKFIIITSFLVTAFVSICTGTSWGSAGTVGVALMGVAAGIGAPLPVVAGAVVSGAYFGDKMSPLSDTTNLAPIAAGTTLYEHIGHMVWTTGPAFILASIVYTLIGFNISSGNAVTPEKVTIILDTLNSIFNWNLLVLLPPVIVLFGSIKKKPTIPVMLISSAIALFNAVVFQHFTLQQAFEATIDGFNISMVSGLNTENIIADIPRLLNRGGMNSMLGTVLIAFCAYGFAGAIAVTDSLDIVLKKLLKNVKSTGGLILSTLISCFVAVCVTSNGQLSILIPGEMFKNKYLSKKLHPKNLSRTLEDGATVIEPLVPWTAAGVYMATTLGVKTLEYLPWAILCYSGCIFAIIWGYSGKFIAKLDEKDKIYQEYLEEEKNKGGIENE